MDKSAFVRRRVGEKYHPDCIVESVKHPLKIMVWSVISAHGTGHLYIVEGTMRQDQYIRVLETKLLPQIGATNDVFIWRNSIVHEELARCYDEGDHNSWLIGDSGYPQ
ncbi:hypothetical protein CBL_08398 [Carabus blaptoides fortunei]